MSDNEDLTAIACLNSQSVTGACMAVEESGNTAVFLAGVDCSKEETGLIENGVLSVTVLQNPYAIGYFSIEAAAKALSGGSPGKTNYTAFRVINKNNLFTDENQRLIFPLW